MIESKFGLRILFKDGGKSVEWYIEKALRDSEYKRYRENWSVVRVKKINRKN